MQAYRGMDIGTAKPSIGVRRRIRHHMIDIAEPEDEVTVGQYQALGRMVLRDEESLGHRVIICGGSGLHFRSLVDPLIFPPRDPVVRAELEAQPLARLVDRLLGADPHAGDVVDLANPRRVVRALEILELTGETPSVRSRSADAMDVAAYRAILPFVGIGIDPGSGLPPRIRQRFDTMLDRGLMEEVAALDGRLGVTASQAVGYKELLPTVRGEADADEAIDQAINATMGLAKRQRTYFRRDPRIAWQPWQDSREERISDALRVIGEVAQWTS